MSAKTTTRVLDKRGVKLVVGQNVTLEASGQLGQLMGINEKGQCLVRISNSSEIVTVLATALAVSSWDQVRQQDKPNSKGTTLF
jgi:hypothetical protein